MSSVAKLYHRLSEEDRRSCWVCFATDEDDMEAGWVQPCMCKGTTKWVHQYCLQRWIDEKQKGNSTAKVACPQCNMEYIILFPKVGPVVYILEKCDKIANMICPFLAGSVIVGSLWWTAVTYGAITVMQKARHRDKVSVSSDLDLIFMLSCLCKLTMALSTQDMKSEDPGLRIW
ncbi:E3 ubiquitin-protein ligase MARCH5, partial [Mytilus galloprovincialis]